ncbi:MAG: hypothetical protein IKX20_06060 [Paludibacteraceae bacterium]|nr:hypothetical protein [Paludibacteraceae bacterium]
MKKIFSVALMAVTMFFMASCGAGSSSSYEQGDPMPSINASEGTVNGHHYDTDTECCWKVTFNYKVKSSDSQTKGSETMWLWTTEFGLVSTQELAMWTAAQTGKYASCSYSYVKTTDKDYEACDKHNNEN